MSLWDHRNFLKPFGGTGGARSPVLLEGLQWLFGLKSDRLTAFDKIDPLIVDPEPTVEGVNCYSQSTNSNGEYITAPDVTLSGDFTINVHFAPITGSGTFPSLSGGGASAIFISYNLAKRWAFRSSLNVRFDLDHSVDVVDGNPHEVTIVRVGSEITLTIDTVAVSLTTDTGDYILTTLFAQSPTTNQFNGEAYSFSAFDATTAVHYPLSEGSGLPQDVSGNSNHATANTGTWTTADDIPSWNGSEGFTPAISSDASGQSIDLGIIDETQFSRVRYTGTLRNSATNQIIVANGSTVPTIGLFTQVGTSINTYFPVLGDRRTANGAFAFGTLLEIDVDYVAETISLDGVAQTLEAGSGTLGHTSTNVHFSGRNGGTSYTMDADTKRLELWVGGTLVRDMTPLSGGRFLDSVNNVIYSNDGTGTLVTKYSPALEHKSKSVATFDGVGDVMDSGVVYTDFADSWEINAVVNYDTDSPADSSIFNAGSHTGSTGIGIRANEICATIRGDSSVLVLSIPTVIGENIVKATWDGIDTLSVTVNGVTDTDTTTPDGVPEGVSFAVYHRSMSGTDGFFDGQMESLDLSINGVVQCDYDFTAYEGKTTTTILDTSGNGNDGTVTTADLDAFWAVREFGRNNGRGQFDGVGDYVATPVATGSGDKVVMNLSIGNFTDSRILAGGVYAGKGISIDNQEKITADFDAGTTRMVTGLTIGSMHEITVDFLTSTILVDGEAVATTLAGTSWTHSGTNISVGARLLSATPSLFMPTELDDIVIYDGTDEVISYDFTTDPGVHRTTITDLSGNGNDGTLTTTSQTAFWQYDVVDAPGGTLVDASNYLALTNQPGLHNGFEGTLIQKADRIMDCIVISNLTGADVGDNGLYEYDSMLNTKMKWRNAVSSAVVQWSGTQWEFIGTSYVIHTTANGTFPDKTGWPVGSGGTAPVLEYDSFYVVSEELDSKSKAEWDAHYLLNGWNNLWLRYEGDVLMEAKQYEMCKLFTSAEASKNLKYFGTGGNATFYANGSPVLYANGFIVYTA